MAWTPNSDYASVNAKLKADPRYAAALTAYQQALAANQTTIAGERQDDTGAGEAANAAKQAAALEFGKVAHQILTEQGITDFDRLGFSPDSGVVAYEPPDHSLRNILIPMAAIATAGILSGVLGGGAGVAQEGGSLASLGGSSAPLADVGLGAAAPVLGPTTAGSLAETAGIVSGAGVPASLAAPGVGASTVAATAAAPIADYATNGAGVVTQAASVPAESLGIGATIGKIASSNWFPSVIGAAANLGGAAIAANQNEKGVEAQAASAKEALDFVKSQAALEQKNFAPYLAAGTGALSKLSYGLGIGNEADYTPTGAPASITPPGDPRVSPTSPAAQFITNTRTQPVWMTAPTGERKQIPANQVQHYLELGAKLEPGQGQIGGSLANIGRMPPPGSETIGTAAGRL